ncbi:nitrite reductase large subunit NirB [Dermatobacter hominis]|uniref:nitrite reductase large subunit NirB n=1 Tax=Dermatobacter hominis TaxID=2884263 RepID=UPI001D10E352|nr:nitrite reductase large subunit NirB [Dermatobacter hominis]UDY35150.1 nitrite reductase large subunit NirB [Dermatobacter hominis]
MSTTELSSTPSDVRSRPRVVVVGNGMVGHRVLTELVDRGVAPHVEVVVVGDERRHAYDRVGLSSLFGDRTPEDLSLVDDGFHEEHGIGLVLGDPVDRIDRTARTVTTASGRRLAYDQLVLATGSTPFVPPVEGSDLVGCHVYRTIDDLDGIRADAERPGVRRGAVIGGGLLGLEAADALRRLGLETHVVEFAPRLMPVQLDDAGGAVLRRHVEELGVAVHLERQTTRIEADPATGRAAGLRFADGTSLDVDLVVFSAGIRPRDQLARDAGLDLGPRGGVAVDRRLVTADPAVLAVGECAAVDGRTFGLVAPGYRMARVAAAVVGEAVGALPAGTAEPFEDGDLSTKLKLLGVDVGSVGDIHGGPEPGGERHSLLWTDPAAGVYQRLDVDRDGRVLAAVLVGDAAPFGEILARFRGAEAVADPSHLLRPPAPPDGADGPSRDRSICSCENVSAGSILDAVAGGCSTVGELKACTRAGTGCGGCAPALDELLVRGLRERGAEVSEALCGHFPQGRAELFELIRASGTRSWSDALARFGAPGAAGAAGAGCEVCKPTVASILASLGGGHILDGEQAALQDTNDHFLANLQRNGTYSVVPRIPGGEITPERLIVIGEVARDFGLYTKITGGQRIDLFGARVEQLPAIWRRLVDAGMESGHAYGKSLRTVKSCVGETWCRYGVADSTSMAIRLEERYRGLRSPHKIKMAVSGCARECAEAQSKDVGVIATERGWNLWVGGNGGARPRHAELLAEDLGDEELVRCIDRFLMYYVHSADRLQRTAAWVESLDGGIDHLRDVVVDDALGLGEGFQAQVQELVDGYECEWRATLEDPERLARFVTFVNAPDEPDPTVVFVRERDQIRPARADELAAVR